jgi:hypothetical protein
MNTRWVIWASVVANLLIGCAAPSAPPIAPRAARSVENAESPPLSQSPVQQVISRSRPEFHRCYEQSDLNRQHLGVKYHYQLLLDPQGKVTGVALNAGKSEIPTPDAALQKCLSQALYALQFPSMEGAMGATVTVPLGFHYELAAPRSQ